MRQKDLKYFGDIQSGRLNADDSPFAITTNEWVNAENVRTGTTDKGVTGVVESVGGNVILSQQSNRIYYLNINEATSATGYELGISKSNYDNGAGNYILIPSTSSSYINFITNPSEPNITSIESGIWSLDLSFSTLLNTVDSYLQISVYTTDSSGTKIDLIGSNSDIVIAPGLQLISYKPNITISSATLSASDRLYIELSITNANTEDVIFLPNSLISLNDTYLITNIATSLSYEYITIGSIDDIENSRLIYFNYDNSIYRNDKIVCLYTDTNTVYDVLLSNQVSGGLNFSKDSLIHSARISNNILSWTDGTNNEPRKINIESAIKSNNPIFVTEENPYSFPLNFWEITMIKRPPIYTPNFIKQNDYLFENNFIADGSFEFAFQYEYYDGEISVVSSYSQASRPNFADQTTLNSIDVIMDAREIIPQTVKIVNLIVRIGNGTSGGSLNASIIKTWNKDSSSDYYDIYNHNNGTSLLHYIFHNSSTGTFLPEDDVLRPFDNVPIYSQTHEVAKNRYFLANNTEGYDTPTYTSLNMTLGDSINIESNTQSVRIYLFNTSSSYWVQLPGYRVYRWSYAAYIVYISQGTNIGFYIVNGTDNYGSTYSTTFASVGTYPTSPLNFTTDLTFAGATLSDVAEYARGSRTNSPDIITTSTAPHSPNPQYILVDFSTTPAEYTVWTHKSTYKFGIVFYDYAMRKSSVCISSPNTVQLITNTRDYAYTEANTTIQWSLDNTNLLTQIPEWAYYYSIVRTLNLRTRFFVQSLTKAPYPIYYVTRDNDGNYSYQFTYPDNAYAIGIDTTTLFQSKLGYTYSEGDLATLWKDTGLAPFTLPVIGQSGNYVHLSPRDIGSLSGFAFAYEIYTPYKEAVNEPYYEVGEIYQILNPATIQRDFSSYTGSFGGDSYVLQRDVPPSTTYLAGAMSPNDLFWKQWETDAGKVNIITRLGQQVKTSSIAYSDTYIAGTQINGTSTFRLGNEVAVPEDCGNITKLQLTSKVQSQGTVMLSICSSETNSMYLGETQIIDNTGDTQFFSASQGVITTINTLKGNYGCINPESVVQYRGNVYYLDVNSGRWVQYSANGLDAISMIKMTRFWKNWSMKYLSMTKAQIELLGNRPYVFATVDAAHDELLISIPKLSEDPPKGYLPDYDGQLTSISVSINPGDIPGGDYMNLTPNSTSGDGIGATINVTSEGSGDASVTINNQGNNYAVGDTITISGSQFGEGVGDLIISVDEISRTIYPFDILDYQGKTIIYKLGTGAVVTPHWQGAYTFNTEYFATMQNRLFTFKNGLIYEHNQDNQNEFFGEQFTSKVMFTSNILPQVPKVYDNFLSESNIVPNFVYFYNAYPYLQTSDLEPISFVNLEGIWYANILRNKIVPTDTGFTTDGLLTAEVMRNTNMFVLVEYSPTTSPLELRILELGTSISKGHTV
jgi:hypothetical protein